MPMRAQACAMKPGQSTPSSQLTMVPETAPTAKRMAVPLAQRCANSRKIASPLRPTHSATTAGVA